VVCRSKLWVCDICYHVGGQVHMSSSICLGCVCMFAWCGSEMAN